MVKALELQNATSIRETPKDSTQAFLSRILKYKVFIICLSLILVGILLLLIASLVPEHGLLAHLLRDIGIVLVTTGLVVLAADYMTRKDFIKLLATELDPLREEVSTCKQSMLEEMSTCKQSMLEEMSTCGQSMLKEMKPLATDMSSLARRLLQDVAPLKQDIPTLSTTLEETRRCISLGATMSALGITQIYENRWRSDLPGKLRGAAAQSDVKILGIIASGVRDPEMQEIIKQKLEANCKFQILCLNPQSRFVEERAIEEGRKPEEMRTDIVAHMMGWKNFVEENVPETMVSQVELKCYDSSTRYFLFITETVVLVGFYLGSGRGANGPHLELEVKDGGIARAFIAHFDSLWKGANGTQHN